MEKETPPCLAEEPPAPGALQADACSSAFALAISQGCFKASSGSSAGSRSAHTGGPPHPCLVWGTRLTSPCEVGVCVLRAPRLLSLAMNSQRVQSQMKQAICCLFSLTEGKGLKPLAPRRHKMKLGTAGGRAPPPLLPGQEILTQTKPPP